MNGEPPTAGRTIISGVRLLADPERGSAPPEIIWLILGQFVAVVGAFALCTAYLGYPWIPVWLSWTLVAVPAASLLWWMTVVSALHRIKFRRNQRVLDEMGPRLAERLDLRADETLTDIMAEQWRQAVATGLMEAKQQPRHHQHGQSPSAPHRSPLPGSSSTSGTDRTNQVRRRREVICAAARGDGPPGPGSPVRPGRAVAQNGMAAGMA